jgi:Arc/MetJ family transcription regulator
MMMRTTINLDEKVLAQVRARTGESSLTKAVHKALSEYVRLCKLRELRDHIGQLELEDNWQELEELELESMRKLEHGPD